MKKWSDILPQEINDLGVSLANRAKEERVSGATIYPPQKDIFRAMSLTPPERVRAVIVGQDPYHGAGQANGLAFSVADRVELPPSLKNIFKELEADIGCPRPVGGDLTSWAESGVLLLNTSLTVEAEKPASHASWGWSEFTGAVLNACAELPQPVAFLLWGRHARDMAAKYASRVFEDGCAVCCSHPSPLGATKAGSGAPAFLGSRTFSRANELLVSMSGDPVDWGVISEGGGS